MTDLREQLHRESSWSKWLLSPVTWIVAAAGMLLVIGGLVLPAIRKMESPPSITIYTSQDQVYSEPMLARFEEETGIGVRAVYDSEAVKTVAIANRLLAERNNPRADVFWNNEELRTHQLARENVFRPENPWVEFGHRSRRLVYNTNTLSQSELPSTFASLTNAVFQGRVVMAYPLFGTTATHMMALRSVWGEEAWLNWIQALVDNDTMVVDGNSIVVQMVARGEADIGLTDIDDILAGQRQGFPVAAGPILPDALLIPNTAAVIRNAPNPQGAQSFLDWIQKEETLQALKSAGAIEGVQTTVDAVDSLQPDWTVMLNDLEESTEQLKNVFLR